MKFPKFTDLPPLSTDGAKFMEDMQKSCRKAAHEYVAAIDTELIRCLEIRLGRVPSSDEIRKHGLCTIQMDGSREYKWKGETVLRVAPIFKGGIQD